MAYDEQELVSDARGRVINQYYDATNNKYEPVLGLEAPVFSSMQKRFRSDFIGTSGPPNPTKWEVVGQGAGQTVALVNNELSITTGVTINEEVVIRSVESFSIPLRLWAGLRLSQRIANQEFYLELISVDENDVPDGDSKAAWRLDGTSATQGKYEVQTGGFLLASAASTIVTTASSGILELELTADEAWFHSRAMDSTNARSNSYVRQQNVPDPDRRYKIQIRAKNLGTAPASTTTLTVVFAALIDYTELTTEITASRGGAIGATSLPVVITSTPANQTVLVRPTTSGGLGSIYNNNALTNTDVAVKTSAGQVYGWHIYNPNAAVVFVQFFNALIANVTPGTTVPFYELAIPPGGILSDDIPIGIVHSTGISIVASSTSRGGAAPTTPILVNIFYA